MEDRLKTYDKLLELGYSDLFINNCEQDGCLYFTAGSGIGNYMLESDDIKYLEFMTECENCGKCKCNRHMSDDENICKDCYKQKIETNNS